MNMDSLQHLLTTVQATQNDYRFETTHENHIKDINLDDIDIVKLRQEAITLFKKKMPNYNVENALRTDLLTVRVLEELKDQITKDTITLTNGCCTSATCPTTVFIECVLKVIK